jgi:hypothetical protein
VGSRQRSRRGVNDGGGEGGDDDASEDVEKVGVTLRWREPVRCRGSGGCRVDAGVETEGSRGSDN